MLIDDDKENSQHIDDVANSLPEIFDQQSSYLEEMDNDMRDISEQLKNLHDGTKSSLVLVMKQRSNLTQESKVEHTLYILNSLTMYLIYNSLCIF